MTAQRRQTTVGFLFGDLSWTYMMELWSGMIAAARTHSANLLCIKGERLDASPQAPQKSANILYSLPRDDILDGVVITSVLGDDVATEEFQRFCSSIADIPVLTIAARVPGLPSVEVDNAHGMREVVDHLIERHGYQRIGFIQGPSGNSEAELRYRAYADALRAHGLPVDSKLVMPGMFTYDSGQQAIRKAFRSGNPGLEAIVAGNDLSGAGALDALLNMGLRVPDDVALAGFDDMPKERIVSPPLTSVRQPIRELGVRALEQMLRMLAGERVPDHAVLPTRMVIRQSCGCGNRDIAAVVKPVGEVPENADAREHGKILIAELQRTFRACGEAANSEQMTRFVEALLHDCDQTESSTCIAVLHDILGHRNLQDQTLAAWQEALSTLRRMLLRRPRNRAARIHLETIFQQLRALLGDMLLHIRGNAHMRNRAINSHIALITRELNAGFRFERMREILPRALEAVQIPSCYVLLYGTAERPLESARMVFAYADGRERSVHDVVFSPTPLIPDTLELWKKPACFMVEALYVETQQIGLALFEIGPQKALVYEMLRTQISSSMRGAMLLQRQQQAQHILELHPVIRQVLDLLAHLTGTSDTLTQISAEMASGAEEISQQISSVSRSSKHISEVIQNVSAATTQEAASITEIASTVDMVLERVTRAVESAQGANDTMSNLAASSQQIGDILSVISGVAKQTKFLALYAAIIAAQSGSFENNFTVVATEVKVLAQETANSAKDIARKIRMIQLSGQDAVEAISRVVASIHQVSEHSAVISTAITEQSSTARQISRTIADAAEQSGIITRTTGDVANVAQDASERASRVQQAAADLLELAEQLQDLVAKFTEVSGSAGK